MFPFFLQLRQKIKDIGALKTHPILKAVQLRIQHGLMNPQLRSVHPQHFPGSGQSRIQGEGTCVSEAVQHARIPAEFLHSQPVIFLIQEKSGLLAVLYVHQITNTVFRDFHVRIKRLSQKALNPFHALFFPFLRIASLIDAADPDSILQKRCFQFLHNHFFHTIHAESQGLYHKHI